MRGVVLEGERKVTVTDVPDAALPGPDGAIVRVDRTAICGSDLHLYHAATGFAGVRLGHEFIGTIDEVGSDVTRFVKGDRVMVSGVIGCGRCVACLAGDPITCRDATKRATVFGTRPDFPGGQAEAVGVPAVDAFARKIPEGISDPQAVLLTDILPTGYLGALRANITPGATVALIGLGPVGLMALRCVQLFGPSRILAIDPVPERRARAEALGAEAIDPSDGGGPAQVMERTNGWGATSVIEAVGADQTISDAVMSVAPGGTVSIVGVNLNFAMPFPMVFAFLKSINIRITYACIPTTWEALVPLVASGKLQPEDVFSHHLGLSEAEDAYRMFDERRDGTMKVLLDPRS
jgi:alcohol dehydrogenase